MTSFNGCANNFVIQFPIYYASHMRIIGQIMAINLWLFIQNYGTY